MQGPFKKYEREPRVKLTEEIFNAGMHFTNAPLSEGQVKLLVNYDISSDGQYLKPRDAFRIYDTGINLEGMKYRQSPLLMAGKFYTTPDGFEKAKVISGSITDKKVEGTKLYYGNLGIHDVTFNTDDKTTLKSYGPTKYQKCRFIKPDGAEVHGIPVEPSDLIARNVGTFAFNGEYYFMQDNLYKTDLEAEEGITKIVPQKLNPKEAVTWGYNMLLPDPYEFVCDRVAGSIPVLTGILPRDKVTGDLKLTPKINEEVTFNCYWSAPDAKYRIIWEWKNAAGTTWTKITDKKVSTNDLKPWAIDFSAPVPQIMLRVTVFEEGANVKEDLALQVMTVGFNLNQEDYGSTANVSPKTYSLNTATGMTYWQNRLVLYGLKEDNTLLFLSEVNNPSYFPYPNCTDVFDEPIIYVTPFQDALLVFTTTSIYMLTLSEDFLSWNKSLVQGNLYIKEWDLHLIKVVKNMVFFKSGNYFYMIVPKLNSLSGELVIAPVSKSISGFLDNFKENVEKTLKTIYNYSEGVKLIHYYNYLDYEDVHNVYVFQSAKGDYISFELLYNTISRHWRIYVSQNNTILIPFRQDATRKGILMGLHEVSSNNSELGIHFVHTVSGEVADEHIMDFTPNDVGGLNPFSGPVKSSTFKNYQYIDTGFREHASDYKKRYREIQLKLNNTSQKELKFYSSFTIDSELRKDYFKYKTVVQLDPTNPKKATLLVERDLVNSSIVPSATVLAEALTEDTAWKLSNSTFPDAIHWKVRIPVSGKGYSAKIHLLSHNQHSYELLNFAWVFRTLYSR